MYLHYFSHSRNSTQFAWSHPFNPFPIAMYLFSSYWSCNAYLSYALPIPVIKLTQYQLKNPNNAASKWYKFSSCCNLRQHRWDHKLVNQAWSWFAYDITAYFVFHTTEFSSNNVIFSFFCRGTFIIMEVIVIQLSQISWQAINYKNMNFEVKFNLFTLRFIFKLVFKYHDYFKTHVIWWYTHVYASFEVVN